MSDSQIIHSLAQSIELTERYANCILNDFKTNADKSALDELGSYILHFDNAIKWNNEREKIFLNYINMTESSSEELNCDSVLAEFSEEIAKAREEVWSNSNSENYKDFMKWISKKTTETDDDITTLSQNINTIDPITKLCIIEPVKNMNCGHVYEKTSILQLISKKPKTKCPVAGCSTTNFVKETDLISDIALKRILANHSSENTQKRLKTQ